MDAEFPALREFLNELHAYKRQDAVRRAGPPKPWRQRRKGEGRRAWVT